MKKKHVILIIALLVIADQALKIYIKTTYQLNTSHKVMGDWFQLYFVENPGMAYGWKFGGNWGKIAEQQLVEAGVWGSQYALLG